MKKNNPNRYVSGAVQTKRFGYGMITPTLIVMAIMTAYPLIFTVYYSFTDYNLLSVLKNPAKFIGFDNYVKLLSTPYFRNAIWNTVRFTLLAVVFEMLVGFIMAEFVHRLKRAQKIMRTLLLIPYLLPMITTLPSSISLGGTGIIIVVGVAMETINALKSQLTSVKYTGTAFR